MRCTRGTGPIGRTLVAVVAPVVTMAALLATTSGPAAGSGASARLSSAACSANRDAGTITYVSPFGYDASVGILDVFAAQGLGYFKDMCLSVNLVTGPGNSTELVSAGRAQVSNIGSAADDLSYVAQGSNIVGVATYGDTSDYALLTEPSVTNLKQLAGKTLGYHVSVPVAIQEMLHAAGVDAGRVDMINTTDYDPNQLVQGKLDAVQAYQSNEPLVLRAEGAHFNEYTPNQFHITGTFNVQIFNRQFYEGHPSAVADFMRAELHAFDYCVTAPRPCIDIESRDASAQGAEFPIQHELEVWQFESALARDHTLPGRGVGVETEAEWAPERQALEAFGVVKRAPSLSTAEATSVVASLYDGRTLIWP